MRSKHLAGLTFVGVKLDQTVEGVGCIQPHQASHDALRPHGGETRGEHDVGNSGYAGRVELVLLELAQVVSNSNTSDGHRVNTGDRLPLVCIKACF